MKFPSKKIASLVVVGVLSVAGLTALTMAVGDNGHWGQSAWAKHGKHHGGKQCQGHKRGGMHGPDHLASKLSAMETEIGIRANQIDAWRDFTDALQATMKRPMGPGGPGGPGMMAPDGNAEPFSLAEHFADNTIERAESAEQLKSAIATLLTTLTPEQLEKVKAIEARLRAKMASHHRGQHGPHGKGHDGKGREGMGPHGGPPAPAASETGPGDTPDAPDDDSDDDGEDE